MKDHQISQIVNSIRDVCNEFNGTQQLRERIASLLVPVLRTHQIENDRLIQLLNTHGVCTDCGEMYHHDIDEPFASCDCKQSEWYSFTPYMRLQERLKEVHAKLSFLQQNITE